MVEERIYEADLGVWKLEYFCPPKVKPVATFSNTINSAITRVWLRFLLMGNRFGTSLEAFSASSILSRRYTPKSLYISVTMPFFEDSRDLKIHGGTFIAHRMEPGKLTFLTTGGDYFAYLISGALRGFDLLTSKALPSAFHMADADLYLPKYPNQNPRTESESHDQARPVHSVGSWRCWRWKDSHRDHREDYRSIF